MFLTFNFHNSRSFRTKAISKIPIAVRNSEEEEEEEEAKTRPLERPVIGVQFLNL